ncbi:MAG: hypothetical protein M5U26_17225 [Planctomycetota bacterium]|nr:hypothetical protein [Planctomycetota bacterium]
MSSRAVVLFWAACLLAALGLGWAYWSAEPEDRIARLARGGAVESRLIDEIDQEPGRFDLTADEIIELHEAGVPDSAIVRMLTHRPGSELKPLRDALTQEK